MSSSLADARFLFTRAIGLIRRGLASLRTRGWNASWQRMRLQLQRGVPMPQAQLYAPEPAPFRIEVSLVKVDGTWLVDNFTPVTGEAAR